MAKNFKEYVLLEDIIIPKGTLFVESNFSQHVNPYEAVIGENLVNSVITITVTEDTIEEMQNKFKEI